MSMEAQPNEVVNVMNAVNAFLEWESINGPPRGYEQYHPSAFGTCLRKMQYQRYEERAKLMPAGSKDFGALHTLPMSAPLEARVARIFATGHSMHDRWAHLFDRMGVLRGVWECVEHNCATMHGLDNKIGCFRPEKCVCGGTRFKYHEIAVVDKNLNMYGHADQILDFSQFDVSKLKSGNPVNVLFDPKQLPVMPIVNDMKTINSNQFDPKGFNKVAKLPKLEHQIQLTIYINVLGLEYGTLIYENKDNSDVKMFKVGKNPDLWNKIQEQALSMQQMVASKLLPPPRPERQADYECKDCRYKSMCHASKIWQDPNLDAKRQSFYNVTIKNS